MRIASVLLGVVLVLFGLTPGIIGLNVRDNTMASLMNLFPPETRQQLESNEQAFERGWFSSETTWEVSYQPLGLAEPIHLYLDFSIRHGPLLATDNGLKFGLAHAHIVPRLDSEELRQTLTEIPFTMPEIVMDLVMGFDQSLTLDATVTPTNYSGSDGEFIFAGIDARLLTTADQAADFTFSMGEFSARGAAGDMGFRISGIELEGRSERINDLLAPASAHMTIDTLSSAGPLAFSAESITADSRLRQSTAGAPRIDFQQRLQIADVESQIPLNSLDWTTEVNEVHSDLIRSYYQLLSELQQQINVSGGTVNAQVSTLGQELALILLRNSLAIENRVLADIYDGSHEIDLSLRWQGLPQLNNATQLDINSAIAATTVDLSVSLDLEAVMRSQAAELVDPYVQQGYLRIDNGRILLDASLQNNQLTINGEVVPLDQFF